MRKKFSKFLFKFVAGAIAAVSVVTFSACKKKTGNNGTSLSDAPIALETVHGGKAEETDKYILKNGKSDYKIVVSATATTDEQKAAGVLQNNFVNSTGAVLPVVTDEGLEFSASAHYVSVGNTALSAAQSVKYEYSAKSANGFQIKTVGESIFVVGETKGVIYGVYELLSRWFDFDCYDVFAYYAKEGVTDLKLTDYDLTELPDIDMRANMFYMPLTVGTDPNASDAMRINGWDEIGPMYENGTIGTSTHNSLFTVNYFKYGTEHPDWYMDEIWATSGMPYQLCYSVNPDINDKNSYIYIVCDRMKAAVTSADGMDAKIYGFTLEDHMRWCHCDRCKALENKYGVNTVGYIRVLNAIAKEMARWGNENYGHPIRVAGMAYSINEEPPVKLNDKGEYEPMDETVVFEPNLSIIYAPINTRYMVSMDEAGNEEYYRKLKGWAALSPSVRLWGYSAMPGGYMLPNMYHNAVQRMYQVYVKYHGTALLELGQWNNYNHTGWASLLVYLQTKLMWNCQLDYATLLDNYFNGYFKSVAPEMRAIFEETNDLAYFAMDMGYTSGNLDASSEKHKKFFTYAFVQNTLDKFAAVYAGLEGIKTTSPDLYETLKQRVEIEEISYRFMLLEFYPNQFTSEELTSKRYAFKADVNRLGFTTYGELYPLTDLWGRWGLMY